MDRAAPINGLIHRPGSRVKLPDRCVSRDPASGRLVLLRLGQPGFQPIAGARAAEDYNRALGLSYEQVEAMEYGALFGFDADLADPAWVRQVRQELGQPVGPIRAAMAATAKPAACTVRPVLPDDLGNFAPWFQEALSRSAKPSV